jgi:hypothetical protein
MTSIMDMTAPRPLLARLNWYWITQLTAWFIVGLFFMSIYGVENSSDGSDINISARRADGLVTIEIANTGAIQQFANSTRVGLANARKRLALAVGKDATLELSERAGWVRATLTMPEAA